ncbi:MAG: Brp/Blh family beta-carotene 15,15'-dioxygenase [Gemmatimonadaceae bacterium]|nr:Brp/Blh family beta-carotene 15,15'-dioxygenase [Gemmatimonadaceae bacterium]
MPIESYLFITVAVATSLLFVLLNPQTLGAGQIAVMSVVVAVLGLPHGALDPLMAHRLGLYHGPLSLLLFFIGYSTLSALIVGLWLLTPVASLVGFLVISAAHFGSDWNSKRPAAIRIFTGLALLSLPAIRDAEQVAQLYVILSGPDAEIVASWQAAAGPVFLVAMLMAAAIASRTRLYEGVELFMAATLALTTPPLVFFTVYFCLLHSARHLREGFATERDALRRPAGRALFGGAALAPVLVAVMLLLGDAPAVLDQRLLKIVFIGLAALTVPHMVVVTIGARAARRARAAA